MAQIHAPVLGLYGGDDPRVVATIEPTSALMKKLGKSYGFHIYPGATHFFKREPLPRQANSHSAMKASRRR